MCNQNEINDRIGYEAAKQSNFAGFAEIYLQQLKNENKVFDKIELSLYKQLATVDAKLGTTDSEQLIVCLSYISILDLNEVRFIIIRP